MAIQTIYDTGSTYPISSEYDAGAYQVGLGDCVVGGVGNEMAITFSSSTLQYSIAAGDACIINGSFFRVTSTTSFTLTANATQYICASIDKTQSAGSKGSITVKGSSDIKHENLNGSGSQRDLILYQVTTNASGVTSSTDCRLVVKETMYITQAAYEALTTKDSQTIYAVIQS